MVTGELFTEPEPCQPGERRSCRAAFVAADGVVCAERFQACGEEAAWLPCGEGEAEEPGSPLAIDRESAAMTAGSASCEAEVAPR